MKRIYFPATAIVPTFTIAWDFGFEIYPSFVGLIHGATAPATFGFQTVAEIITSAALLYLIFGRRPKREHDRELVTSSITVTSFLLLAAVSAVYVIWNWNVVVPHDVRAVYDITFWELFLSTFGVVGNIAGIAIERWLLRKKYSATLDAHSHQLWLCLLSSAMVGLAAIAPSLGWSETFWITPETFGGVIITLAAGYEGISIWKKRGVHHHH